MTFLEAVSMQPAGKSVPAGPAAGAKDRLAEAAPLGARVAIVEDELMVAWALESLVEDLGCEVTGIYARGEAALAGIKATGPDLVLLDINLTTGMDGVETARRLRMEQIDRIIFISAYADPATEARIMKQVPGARLLRKPVASGLLEQAIREAMSAPH